MDKDMASPTLLLDVLCHLCQNLRRQHVCKIGCFVGSVPVLHTFLSRCTARNHAHTRTDKTCTSTPAHTNTHTQRERERERERDVHTRTHAHTQAGDLFTPEDASVLQITLAAAASSSQGCALRSLALPVELSQAFSGPQVANIL
jgi:hypothetical protein